MASYHPPSEVLSIFNDLNYQVAYGSISLADASATFLKLTGGSLSGMLYANGGLTASSIYSPGTADVGVLKIAGNVLDVSLITGVTPGTASASKALIVDANKDITGIRYLTATQLTGTLQTASQPNITSIGTLTTLNLNGSFNFSSNVNTTMNNNLIITGSASSPTTTNGIGFAFSPMINTGRIKAYNYPLAQFNNITMNEGAIYIKADKTVSINKETNGGYALDVNGDVSCNSNWRNGSTVLMNNTGIIQYPTQLNITRTAHNDALKTCGFENKALSTISYDASTRIFTITPMMTYNIWVAGTRYTISTTLTTVAHATTKGVGYYIYFDSDANLIISSTAPDLLQVAMVAYVYYYDSSNTLFLEERHGTTMDPETHRELHLTQGTFYVSGLALSGYTLNGTTDAHNTFASSSGIISDEDLRSTISAISDGGPYTVMYMDTANSDWRFGFSKTLPYANGTYIQYNQWTGSIWQLTELATNNWICYYIVYTPSVATATQMVLIPGQTVYTNLASAQAESFYNLSTASLTLPEFLPLYQLIFRTNAAYTTTGKCRLEAVNRIVGNKAIITGSTSTNHQALSGLQLASAGNTYGHIDDQTQTIAGAKTFSDITTVSNTTDSSSSTDGALIVSGGCAIAKRLYVASTINSSNNVNITTTNNDALKITNTTSSSLSNIKFVSDVSTFEVGVRGSGTTDPKNGFYIYKTGMHFVIDTNGKVGINRVDPAYQFDVSGDISSSGSWRNSSTILMNSSGVLQVAAQTNITSLGTLTALNCSGVNTFSNTTDSTSSTTGALILSGGCGIAKKLYVGTHIDTPLLKISGTDFTSSQFLSITAGTAAASKALVLDSNLDIGTIRYVKAEKLFLGNVFTDTTRLISCLDSTITNSSTIFALCCGKANSLRNQFEISYYHAGDGSVNNQLRLGRQGGAIMYVDFNDRVGIMNSSPGYALDVTGDCNVSGSYKMDGTDVIDSSKKFVGSAIDTTGRITMRQDNYGFSLRGHSSYTAKEMVSHIDSTGCSFGCYSNDDFHVLTNNTKRIGVDGGNGDVWIGADSTSAYAKVYIEGNDTYQYCIHCVNGFDVTGVAGNSIASMLYSSSSIGYSSSWTGTHKVGIMVENGGIQVNGYHIASYSDRRKKDNIQYYNREDHKRIIDAVDNIKIAKFRYKSDGHQAFGVIAQDFALSGLDEVLTIAKDEQMKIDGEGDIDGYSYSVDYDKIALYLIPYVQKLKKQNFELKHNIKALELEIDNLHSRMDQIILMLRDDSPLRYDLDDLHEY